MGDTVYASTVRGVVTFTGEAWEPTLFRGRRPVKAVETESNDTLVVVGGRCLFLEGRGEMPQFSGLDPARLTCVHTDGSEMWAGTLEGLFYGVQQTWEPVDAVNGLLTTDQNIRDIAAHDGTVAIAAQDGLFLKEGDTWTRVIA